MAQAGPALIAATSFRVSLTLHPRGGRHCVHLGKHAIQLGVEQTQPLHFRNVVPCFSPLRSASIAGSSCSTKSCGDDLRGARR